MLNGTHMQYDHIIHTLYDRDTSVCTAVCRNVVNQMPSTNGCAQCSHYTHKTYEYMQTRWVGSKITINVSCRQTLTEHHRRTRASFDQCPHHRRQLLWQDLHLNWRCYGSWICPYRDSNQHRQQASDTINGNQRRCQISVSIVHLVT